MKRPSDKFNIKQYTRVGFDLVVELDDEVEYLLDKEAAASLQNNEATIILKRLVDGKRQIVAAERIIKSLQKEGPIDYLKIK